MGEVYQKASETHYCTCISYEIKEEELKMNNYLSFNCNEWKLVVTECFRVFSCWLLAGFVQYLLFMYQRGCLYRLKALGERHNMDITVEGFHSWMWKGLGFIIPFLLTGYIWELYNAYVLYLLSFSENADWHVSTIWLYCNEKKKKKSAAIIWHKRILGKNLTLIILKKIVFIGFEILKLMFTEINPVGTQVYSWKTWQCSKVSTVCAVMLQFKSSIHITRIVFLERTTWQ